jgi:hypothetical protein
MKDEEDSEDERISNMTDAFYQEEDTNGRFHRVYNKQGHYSAY